MMKKHWFESMAEVYEATDVYRNRVCSMFESAKQTQVFFFIGHVDFHRGSWGIEQFVDVRVEAGLVDELVAAGVIGFDLDDCYLHVMPL